jgi:hypothetical protein
MGPGFRRDDGEKTAKTKTAKNKERKTKAAIKKSFAGTRPAKDFAVARRV